MGSWKVIQDDLFMIRKHVKAIILLERLTRYFADLMSHFDNIKRKCDILENFFKILPVGKIVIKKVQSSIVNCSFLLTLCNNLIIFDNNEGKRR